MMATIVEDLRFCAGLNECSNPPLAKLLRSAADTLSADQMRAVNNKQAGLFSMSDKLPVQLRALCRDDTEYDVDYSTADQVREYAADAVAAEREKLDGVNTIVGAQLTQLVALRERHAEAVRALDYYRAAFRRERPAYVPATIRLLHDVRGDAPLGHRSVARAGKHECECNQFGAVSVRAEDGHMLGIKPAEFEPVTWRAA